MDGKKGGHDAAGASGCRMRYAAAAAAAGALAACRIAALIPFFLGEALPDGLRWGIFAFLYILLVIPMRFYEREAFRRAYYTAHGRRKGSAYLSWLGTGLYRYMRGILWGLPFLAGLFYFTVMRQILDAKTMWMPIRSLAVLVGQEPNIGTGAPVALGLMVVFGLMFAYGWRRDLPVEYLPADILGPRDTVKRARRMMKRERKSMLRVSAVNALLCLPALAGGAAVLLPYVRERIDLSLSPDMVFTLAVRMLRAPLPEKQAALLILVFLILYLPLCLYRKLRNAALIGRAMKARGVNNMTRDEERDGHAAG